MNKSRLILISLLVALYLASCGRPSASGKDPYIGAFGEAMVFCDFEFWNSDYANDTLKQMLTSYVPAAMPAQEQLTINHAELKYFKKGSPRKFRNIIHIDIGDKLQNQKPTISYTTGQYAKDQLIVYVRAKTTDDMKALLNQGCSKIINRINDKEAERKQTVLEFRSKKNEERNIREKKDYNIVVPAKYTVLLDTGNVLWMSKITSRKKDEYNEQKFLDVVVTTYPYTSAADFKLENMIAKRDETLKILTYNEERGTFRRFQEKEEPLLRVLKEGEEYSVEIRSMWTTDGKFQGGPSIQYVQLDYKRGRIIHADGRAYAPGFSKRELIRELEAIIKSVEPIN